MQEFVTIPTYLIRELPQDKLYALMDFLSMADENNEILISIRQLMNKWKWSNTKVTNFIKTLEEKDIGKTEKRQKTITGKDTVFIVNREFISNSKDTKKDRKQAENNQEKDTEDKGIYKRIIDYLNRRCGTRYTEKNKQTKESIHARLAEKFTEEDFYTVIDKKCNEWLGTEMERYLRPQTLFGTKFESYLNQNIVKEKGQTAQMLENHYDMVSEWARKKKMQEGFNDG